MVVSDTGNNRVQIFDREGKWIRSFGSRGSAPGLFAFPHGLALDFLDHIAVCDTNNNRLQIFDSDGRFIRSIGPRFPLSLPSPSLSGSGEDGDGSESDREREEDDGVREEGHELHFPFSVAFDSSSHRLAVCNTKRNCIDVFEFDGRHVRSFGQKLKRKGDPSKRGKGPSVGPSGERSTRERSTREKEREEGEEGEEGEESLEDPFGVAIDCDGNFIVCDSSHHSLRLFDPSGFLLSSFPFMSHPSRSGSPSSVAIDSEGNAVVCDSNNHRLVFF